MRRLLVPLAVFILSGCASPPSPAVTPQLVNVFVTSATYPRVSELYACAPPSIVLSQSDPASAAFTLRLGEPSPLLLPAFQVGTEDVLVVNHPGAGVGALTLEQVQGLFSGRIANWKEVGGNDLPVQVWTFSPEEDIQQVFEGLVMNGEPVTSLARLAVSAQAMSDGVGSTPGSTGYLAGRWKAGNTREALKAATVPVLIITRSQPEGPLRDLIGCLQAEH
ncbi:MAG TPA: substrate-binding domain-containing protein [Anaerolineales bacterium]